MKYLDLLQESVNRMISKKLKPKAVFRMRRLLLRKQFFSDLENSNGKILLNFFEISEPLTYHTKTADVSKFMVDTLKIPLRCYERSIVFDYLKEIGAHWRRTSTTTYFSNLKIKEYYANYDINGIKPRSRDESHFDFNDNSTTPQNDDDRT